MRTNITLLCIFFSCTLLAQAPPNTNIYLFDLIASDTHDYHLTQPKFLTNFNASGYNNQPVFISNDEIMLTVQVPSETQTDLYHLNLADKIKTRFTGTYESEYSAGPVPTLLNEIPLFSTRLGSNPQISCVRVATDENKTQYLWQYPFDRSSEGSAILEDLTGVGYYAWSSVNKVVLFIVGEPHTLVAVDLKTNDQVTITSNIGRCLRKFPNGDIAFVHMIDEKTWLLKRLNMSTYQPELVTAMLEGVEDFVLLKDGTALMAQGSKVYKFNRNKDISWKEIADLSRFGLRDISRMAVNAAENKVVLVNER